jgi:hypothetical protein
MAFQSFLEREVSEAVVSSATKYLDFIIDQRWNGNFDVALACRERRGAYEALIIVLADSPGKASEYVGGLDFTYDDWRPNR